MDVVEMVEKMFRGRDSDIELLPKPKHLVTILVSLIGIFVLTMYLDCVDGCNVPIGTIAGLSLIIAGFIFSVTVIVLAAFGRDSLLLPLLSAAVGGEVFLVGYQVATNTYCIYCLLYAGTVVTMFALNFNHKRILAMATSTIAGLVFFWMFFSGSIVYAAPPSTLPTYGSGPVEIRAYTSFLCPSCQTADQGPLNSIVSELVAKKRAKITFIEVPLNQFSMLYANYYLSAINDSPDIGHNFRVRAALFAAGKQRIITEGDMARFLTQKGISAQPRDMMPPLKQMNAAITEDRVSGVPTFIIVKNGKQQRVTGARPILDALAALQSE